MRRIFSLDNVSQVVHLDIIKQFRSFMKAIFNMLQLTCDVLMKYLQQQKRKLLNKELMKSCKTPKERESKLSKLM